jgi:hypothetical protein
MSVVVDTGWQAPEQPEKCLELILVTDVNKLEGPYVVLLLILQLPILANFQDFLSALGVGPYVGSPLLRASDSAPGHAYKSFEY